MRRAMWNGGMYLRLLSVQLRSQMSYRLSFWMELVSTGLSNGVIFLSIALIIQRFGSIAGWSLSELAFLYGLIEASFGMMDMVFSGFDSDYFLAVLTRIILPTLSGRAALTR
jgi:ABC-2 type transport system permease protein